jgi:hypothetical protein
MRYEVALKEKNVKKQDLSKTLQTKIDAIGKLVEKVHSAKTPEQAAAAKDDLDELDIEIARGIKKFNPEVHQRRLASIANINDKRAVEPKIEKKPKPQPIEKEVEIEQEDLVEEYKQEESNDEVEQAPVRSARVERLEELQRKAREAQYLKYRQQELEQQRAQELDAEDEIKDFQKAKSVKPKGTSLSITLMGIGVFFLTWGTVNYFRTRKG